MKIRRIYISSKFTKLENGIFENRALHQISSLNTELQVYAKFTLFLPFYAFLARWVKWRETAVLLGIGVFFKQIQNNTETEGGSDQLGSAEPVHELSRKVGKLSPSFRWLAEVGHAHFRMFGPKIW